MSEQPAASTTGGAHPHPQHALPVGPKHGAGEKKGGGAKEKFQLGFLGGGMMASALIRGLIKAEVRERGMDVCAGGRSPRWGLFSDYGAPREGG